MEWCTLLGGAGDEVGRWLTMSPSGVLAVTGMTTSGDFPVSAGAFDTVYNGNEDMFIATYDNIVFD